MKTKKIALLFACILCTTLVILLYGDPFVQPSIQNLVSETPSHLVELETKTPDPEEIYLRKLGFVNEPRLYPADKWSNVSIPVFVTAVGPSDSQFALTFLKSFFHYFPGSFLVVYNLGLSPSDQLLLTKLCNASNCHVRNFEFKAYPSHIGDLQLYAYRPIIIQEILNQAGAVIMMDIKYVFDSGDTNNVLSQAKKEGLCSWTIDEPTSALTHPRMFDYFNTRQEKFFFHRMVQPNHIIIYNTKAIHFKVMHPWVKCALIPTCIAPIGAQNSGCRFDKKPLYRYSGCHRYDTSALNVILGLTFDFQSSHYAAKEEDKFFHLLDIDKESFYESEKNTTLHPEFVKYGI